MSGMGSAVMGTGEASGDQRATIAAEEAIANPLLDDVSLKGARGLLLSITGGRNLTLYEVDEAASRVRQEVDPEANIIVGATFDETLGDRVRVSIVASGMMRTENGAAEAARSHSPRADMRSRPLQPPSVMERPTPSFARASAEDDIKRRLSEAIEQVQEQSAARQTPPAVPSSGSAQRQAWRAPGNVLIEEGFAQMAWPDPAARAREQNGDATHGGGANHFTPAPPAEIRRGARRMPDVDDFPPVGQREYRAKVGHASPTPLPPPLAPSTSASQEPPRRGLLQRIINRARGLPEQETFSPYEEAAVGADQASGNENWWQQDGDSNRNGATDDQAPLPIVLNRLRK
jgi:cell division protein FtsZ